MLNFVQLTSVKSFFIFCTSMSYNIFFLLLQLQESDNLETELRKLKKELENEKVEKCSSHLIGLFLFL